MKSPNVTTALLAAAFMLTPRLEAAILSGPTLNPANGHSYYIIDTPSGSWLEAESEALTLGGHLATINDASENAFVLSLVSISATAIIGLFRTSVSNPFQWSSGEPVTYMNWAPDEPNNTSGIDFYAAMYAADTELALAGSWHDAFHGYTSRSVAEVIPEPSAMLLLLSSAAFCLRRRTLRPSERSV